MKKYALVLSTLFLIALLLGACGETTPAETAESELESYATGAIPITESETIVDDETTASSEEEAIESGETPEITPLIINNEAFTVTAERGFDNSGYTVFQCDTTDTYSFLCEEEDGCWNVTLLDTPFEDALRYLKNEIEPDLVGNGLLTIEEGTYIYIQCDDNAFTAETAPQEDLEIRRASDLCGEYSDTTGGRAVATVIDITDGDDEETELYVKIHWGSSATESTVWTMTCEEEDGHFVYDDCAEYMLVTDDQGEGSSTLVYEDGEGYFTLQDGKLLWDGAAEEDCVNCVFEK